MDFVRGFAPTVQDAHRLRTRKSGSERMIDMHIEVPPTMTVREAHDLTDRITAGIKEHFIKAHVLIHVEPGRDG